MPGVRQGRALRAKARYGPAWLLAAVVLGCAHGPREVPADALLEPLRNLAVAGSAGSSAPAPPLVLVSYFATWCLPCLAQVEALRAVQLEYQARGFTVVAVGMDLDGARVLTPFADEYQLPFPVLIADERIREGQTVYGRITALPANFLVHRRRGLLQLRAGPVDLALARTWVAGALQP